MTISGESIARRVYREAPKYELYGIENDQAVVQGIKELAKSASFKEDPFAVMKNRISPKNSLLPCRFPNDDINLLIITFFDEHYPGWRK